MGFGKTFIDHLTITGLFLLFVIGISVMAVPWIYGVYKLYKLIF